MKETIEDHSFRIDTICNYIDMLLGDHGKPTNVERKSFLFNSFPRAWREEFMKLRPNPENATVLDITDFMEKAFDDEDGKA